MTTQPFSVQKMTRTRERTAVPESLLIKILEDAVNTEEQSYSLYVMMLDKASLSSSKALLRELAQSEIGHKEKLLAIIHDKTNVSQLGSPTGANRGSQDRGLH